MELVPGYDLTRRGWVVSNKLSARYEIKGHTFNKRGLKLSKMRLRAWKTKFQHTSLEDASVDYYMITQSYDRLRTMVGVLGQTRNQRGT